jgi:DNA-binding transcriptional regulator YhcF (GntR family)
MKTLDEKKKERFLFLKQIYEQKTKPGLQLFELNKIAVEAGIDLKDAYLIAEYLEGENLIEILDGNSIIITITHKGMVEVERAISKPEKATDYFPPVVNILNVQQMHNSQIMQGSNESSQTFNLSSQNKDSLNKFIELFEQKFQELQFKSEDDKNEAIVEVQTIKTQLTSPRPKELVIQESKKTLRNILEGMSGSILAYELLKYLFGAT